MDILVIGDNLLTFKEVDICFDEQRSLFKETNFQEYLFHKVIKINPPKIVSKKSPMRSVL